MPTRDQARAQAAFATIQVYRNRPEKEKADYKSLALGLPALIHDCGLCQTVAFLQAKAKKGEQHKRMLGDLCRMLLAQDEDAGQDRLGSAVRAAELARYQQLSMDALRCAEYLKRYAEAFLDAALPGANQQERRTA